MPFKRTGFLGLPCLVCKNPLGSVDALRCQQKKVNHVFRNGRWHGICTVCLEEGLRIERKYCSKPILTVEELETEAKKPLRHIFMRCYFCGGLLSHNEKLRHLQSAEWFVKARNHYRGRCYDCYSDGRGTAYD
ncbi:early protein E6 [Camelus dromedarius papillomavirus 3]|nr:early protein E6 [Camelus dromedarius papillomavirus 3]